MEPLCDIDPMQNELCRHVIPLCYGHLVQQGNCIQCNAFVSWSDILMVHTTLGQEMGPWLVCTVELPCAAHTNTQ